MEEVWTVLAAFLGALLGAGGTILASRHRTRSEDDARRWTLKQSVYFDVLDAVEPFQDAIIAAAIEEEPPHGTPEHKEWLDKYPPLYDELVNRTKTLALTRARCIVVGGVPVANVLSEMTSLHGEVMPSYGTVAEFHLLYERLLHLMNVEIGATRNPNTKVPVPMPAQFCGN
jgi:hypothetical protein